MALEVKPGIKVVRGPDWKWGNQDGGEGHVGTVVEAKTAEAPSESMVAARVVLVQWDNGNRCNYRCGIEGKFDLLMYDNGPVAVIHPSIICDSCRENGIMGMRWKCLVCHDFDLCTSCYMGLKHTVDHRFARQDSPETPKVHLPARGTAKRIQAKGLFADAIVSRGHDWIWGDQDGHPGSNGKLLSVKGWEKDTFRSVAEVEWNQSSNKKNVYRVGHKGKIDLKAVTPGDGWMYIPSHLPVLGKPGDLQSEPGTGEDKKPQSFVSGDSVRVQLDLELFKEMQDGHGGWNDSMADILSKVGTVHSVLDSGDLRVKFPNSQTWTLNPGALSKVVQFSVGDVVKVIDDMSVVHDLQEGHGGWVDDIALALGQPGRVVKVFPTGDIRVSVNGRVWTLNSLCLVPAPDENPPEVSAEVDDIQIPEDMDVQLKLLALLENPAVIVAAAASGDVSTMRDFLSKHPKEVNTKAAGKAAIHCAAVAGNIPVLKCLLEYDPDLEIEDEDGDKPLHLCAFGDEDEAAKLLLDSGANVNCMNRQRGATPLFIAAAKGHVSVMKVLLENPNIDLNFQDKDGDNVLHCGVLGQKHVVVATLLEAGMDPELVNFRLFTPIHEAARIGFLPAMELFLKRNPQYVNLPKDDGYTPVHLAALNNHLDLLTTMLESEECDINFLNNDMQTALHVAVHQGHGQIVERLVGFGASLNLQDKDGDTPLHIALMRETLDTISVDSPQLAKVRTNFHIEGDGSDHSSAVMACFLVQEGAELYLQNHKGNTPLLICSPDIAALVTKFVDENKEEKSTFHGSLRQNGSLPLLSAATGNNPPVASAFGKLKQVSPPPIRKEIPAKRLQPSTSTSSSEEMFLPSSSTTANEECMLCDGEVDVVLKPCNHSVICRECSKRAKKCPECRRRVSSVEDLVPKCIMCEEDDATVTLLPCKHMYCPECCVRLKKKCMECKLPIESKLGFSEPMFQSFTPSPSSSGQQRSLAFCEICCERPRNTALTCGHQFCEECSRKVDNCPICRKFIQHRIQLFQ